MLKRNVVAKGTAERGDTLIEVTIALSILAFVLLSSTTVVTLAFRTGQTARERTVVSEAAQEQMEALRSFRDNNPDWTGFQAGVDPVLTDFHMALQTTGSTTQWVPVAGDLDAASLATSGMNIPDWVPTSTMHISSGTLIGDRDCGYDFTLNYQFDTLGGNVPAKNEITTRLTNLQYVPPTPGNPVCP